MFCPPRGAKKGISLWTNNSVQRCLYPLFQNQSPHFLLFSLFWKLSQPLGQDQQNNKQTYCQLPIIKFLWTPKGFISPKSFLNFLLNLYIPPWLPKSFKFLVLRILQIHLWVKKLNLFNFNHAPKQNSPPGFYPYPHYSRTAFSEDISWAERGWIGLCNWKILPKLTRVLVTNMLKCKGSLT